MHNEIIDSDGEKSYLRKLNALFLPPFRALLSFRLLLHFEDLSYDDGAQNDNFP